MTRLLVTPPALEPVSLADLKAHARVETDADDTLIGTYVIASRMHVEASSQLAMVNQTWRFYRDAWPEEGPLELAIRPVQSVLSITVYDEAGNPTLLDADDYRVDLVSNPIRIYPVNARARAIGQQMNGLEIEVVAGYGPTSIDVPKVLRLAILQLAAFWYDNRASLVGDSISLPIPDMIEPLVAPFRTARL
ncbi:head-tail connector protein [Coralliovum pocilloporae]|uniref:head-tail connector protein n=1 Tax=Coralliovum pocilloporae TaxID=3066369 RepID=UPI003306D8C1